MQNCPIELQVKASIRDNHWLAFNTGTNNNFKLANRHSRSYLDQLQEVAQKFRNARSENYRSMKNLERLTKIFEMNVPEKTVPFDSRPKISEFLPKCIAPLFWIPSMLWVTSCLTHWAVGMRLDTVWILLSDARRFYLSMGDT